ncbi:MAG: tetratricopeptide repeat protein [Kofleriaceae bacterium]
MRTFRRLAVAVVVGLALASTAVASPGDPEYLEGRRFYDLHEWDKAIAAFKDSYRLRTDAASLFNIAQAYRLKGDCLEARSFYMTYQRNFPDASNLAIVEKFLLELEPCAAARQAAKPAPVIVVSNVEREPTPVHREPTHTKRTAGLVVGGLGVALVGTGIVLGAVARAKADDVSNGGDPVMPPVFDAALEASGKRYATFAALAWGVGGAAIAGGVVLYLLGRREASAGLTVVPQAHGAVVVWSLTP